jgi:class 3 adenylate cyclase
MAWLPLPRARLVDAQLARSDRWSAAAELEAARDVFERLGAALQARSATAVLPRIAVCPPAKTEGSQRITQTLLFTDIVGSTGMIAVIGDDAWVHLRRWHDATLWAIFARHSGKEIDHAGDGFFVAFATEADAIGCAVEIQRSLDAHRRMNGFAPQRLIAFAALHRAVPAPMGSRDRMTRLRHSTRPSR